MPTIKLDCYQNDHIHGPDDTHLTDVLQLLKAGINSSSYVLTYKLLPFEKKQSKEAINEAIDDTENHVVVFTRIISKEDKYEDHLLTMIENGQVTPYLSAEAFKEASTCSLNPDDHMLYYIDKARLTPEQCKIIGLKCE